MGVDIAKAALTAGEAVVATGRNTDRVKQAGDPCDSDENQFEERGEGANQMGGEPARPKALDVHG